MATYAIGDIQGCYNEFELLLQEIKYDPARDHLILLGDLVNRGPDSLSVIRFAMQHETSVEMVLGNHELHLLTILENVSKPRKQDSFTNIMQASDRGEICEWLCQQPFAIHKTELNVLAVHAGIHPYWSLDDCLKHANEVEILLRGPQRREFLTNLFGNKPKRWKNDHSQWDRARVIVNILTRMRYIRKNGKLNFSEFRTRGQQEKGLIPWFEFPQRKFIKPTIVFGHWSSLGVFLQPGIVALDSGCCWGNSLSAAQLDSTPFKISQIRCK